MKAEEIEEEYRAITFVLASFWDYGEWARQELIEARVVKYRSLLEEDKKLIPWFQGHLKALEYCISKNEIFFRRVVSKVAREWVPESLLDKELWQKSTVVGFERVKSVLLQLNREWSEASQKERAESFGKILGYLDQNYKNKKRRQNMDVLVPGVGLSRLSLDIIQRGFRCQGNEFSYFMLIVSNYILNCSNIKNEFEIYPFLHRFSNQISRKYQIRKVLVPDINASEVLKDLREIQKIDAQNLMSICSGSFIDLYGPNYGIKDSDFYDKFKESSFEFRASNEEKFDIIITSFFIDTSANIFEYVKAIKWSLKPDGVWINFGPLLWHYEQEEDTFTVAEFEDCKKNKQVPMKGLELTREDLLQCIKSMGFEFKVYENNVETTYGNDGVNSGKVLAEWVYRCEFWVCNKKKPAASDLPFYR
ncbi:S-adenosylmethionine-dependent methyltransferase [Ascoidea rubescens DSM 1968]|uniref:carnosine N-methyltransferase n=1 Tax=Ascoidea rubescens DSM 1968 TaxID=1344418 RepID=A0A1D2VLH1_9ASCO|nr:N2227-domain-containing protein [Ascoidea rubescens DSM 1968]ODV62387.1 N2227-domain-containing protein [Ascoidea rubescens DSM 1968]